jgi:hypothetical protein
LAITSHKHDEYDANLYHISALPPQRLALWRKASSLVPSSPVRVMELTPAGACGHILRMKRTNLVLDERLLEEATRLAGEKTYS